MSYPSQNSLYRSLILGIIIAGWISACNPNNVSIASPSNSPAPDIGSEPTLDVSPTRIPSQTKTPIPLTSTPSQVEEGMIIDQWKGIDIGPPGITLAHEEDFFLTLESPDPLPVIDAFYRSGLIDDGWIIIESIEASETRFEGEIIFVHYWNLNDQSLCILAASNPKPPSPQAAATVIVSFECGSARMTAENLRSVPWGKPENFEWVIEDFDKYALSLPAEWEKDLTLDQQPVCSQDQINCIVSYTFQVGESDGIFTIFSWPVKDPDHSLLEQSINTWQDGSGAVPGIYLISIEPIQLNDGNEAVQIISVFPTPTGSGLLSSVTTIKENIFYSINTTILGDFPAIAGLNEIAIAAARSFVQKGTP